ncbi:MAG: preprotein translocase subunit SecE [Flavobacteriaceae bacterium]|nr:preprotein translocase subunit SecE [Flavobacteriaceae bacterium]
MMGIVNYVKESFGELKNNVTWMPWNEAQKNTVLVAVFTIIFAIAVFLVDKFFQMGLEKYFNIFN